MQKKKAALRPEDKVLQDAWDELDEMKMNYVETKWHLDKMKKKIHARNDIYGVYDKCAGVSVVLVGVVVVVVVVSIVMYLSI